MTVAAKLPQADTDGLPMILRYLCLFVFAVLITAPGISRMPPVDRDESRYLQATKQMVLSGDYVDIRMQEAARYNKPVGIYWLQSAVVHLSGMGAAAPVWIYRLVSVLGATIAVLAIFWTGTRLFGPNAGFIAGLVLAGMFSTAFEGRIAKTDSMLLAFVVLSQGALAQLYLGARRQERVAAHLPWLFWIAQGLGILIKGPITPLVSALTILALITVDRDWRWLAKLRAGRGLAIVALIVLPWLAMISWKSGGAFWQESVGKDLLAKVGQGQESHWGPPGYYALTFSLYFWPFGLVAIDAGLRALNSARHDARLMFCLAWYIPFWLVFEIISTKLPHYAIPAYPALALLVGWVMTLPSDAAMPALRTWQRWVWRLTAFGHIVVTAGLGALAVAAPIYLGVGFSPWSLAVAAFALLAGYFSFPRQGRLSLRQLGLSAASAGAAYALLFGVVVPSLSPIWLSPRIAQAVRDYRPCEHSVLASAGFHEPSLVFLTATNTVLTDADGAAHHLLADPECALALVPVERGGEFEARLTAAGKTAQPLTKIDGINYSSGDRVALTLYRLAR